MFDGIVENRRIDEVWFEIFEMKNFVIGLRRFFILVKFIIVILLILYSNVDCERLFLMVRKNRIEFFLSMVVGIFFVLIVIKINFFGNFKCY